MTIADVMALFFCCCCFQKLFLNLFDIWIITFKSKYLISFKSDCSTACKELIVCCSQQGFSFKDYLKIISNLRDADHAISCSLSAIKQ